MKINHSKPYFDDREKDALLSVLDSAYVTSGPLAEKLGKTTSNFTGRKFGIPTQSGTDALTATLHALNLPEKTKVAVPAYICSAPLDALHLCGLIPYPIDIDIETLSISVEAVNQTENISAVIAAHLFGIPAPLYKISHKNIIEDCAQTLGTEIDGIKTGSMGIASVCSFYGTKLLTSGHGGAVLTDDRDLYENIKKLIIHDKQEEWTPHLHFMMSDLNAALALAQFAKLDEMLKKRIEIASRFQKALGVSTNKTGNVYSRFLVISDRNIETSIKMFNEAGIEAKRPVYKPLFHYLGRDPAEFPNAQWAHDNIISVPIYPAMTENEIEYLETFLEKNKNDLRCWPPA